MTNDQKNNAFSYTYSAKEQEEIKRIREKYAPSERTEDKMEMLRRLDESVTRKSTVLSLIFGILGTLALGVGMSLIMTDIGDALGAAALPVGILLGLLGLLIAASAYPVYVKVTNRERKRIAPEIIRLSDELMK